MSPLKPYNAPKWAQKLARIPSHTFPLGLFPTPLQRWKVPGIPEDWEIWIKRDDLDGLIISGNKVRKLRFILADALSQKPAVNTLITIGGVGSNHCRATAVAANLAGLRSDLILRCSDGEDEDPGLRGNMMINRLMGARVHTVTRSRYKQEGQKALVDTLDAKLREQGDTPYKIPVGGSTSVGVFGYIDFVRELEEQCEEQQVPFFEDIAFACGSGGTAAGIAIGLHLKDPTAPSIAHAVCACDDAEYFEGHVQEMMDDLEMPRDVTAKELPSLDVIEGYVGIGYAKSTLEEIDLIRDVAQQTGVVLDPVYSGKALHGLVKEIKTNPGRFKSKRVLFVHTGGLFGVYDQQELLSQSLDANGESTIQKL